MVLEVNRFVDDEFDKSDRMANLSWGSPLKFFTYKFFVLFIFFAEFFAFGMGAFLAQFNYFTWFDVIFYFVAAIILLIIISVDIQKEVRLHG